MKTFCGQGAVDINLLPDGPGVQQAAVCARTGVFDNLSPVQPSKGKPETEPITMDAPDTSGAQPVRPGELLQPVPEPKEGTWVKPDTFLSGRRGVRAF